MSTLRHEIDRLTIGILQLDYSVSTDLPSHSVLFGPCLGCARAEERGEPLVLSPAEARALGEALIEAADEVTGRYIPPVVPVRDEHNTRKREPEILTPAQHNRFARGRWTAETH